jgi:hypothetical protein
MAYDPWKRWEKQKALIGGDWNIVTECEGKHTSKGFT